MLLPHLKIKSEIVPEFVLLPGDPARVDIIGKQLTDFKIIQQNREFKTGIGTYNNISVLVCSTGIGCSSSAIVTEELISAGAKKLIRIGTCGGAWRKDIKNGTFIIPFACVRDEGTTLEYIPEGFPAVADIGIMESLRQSAKKNNSKYIIGINRTHDSFYGNQDSIKKWGNYLLDQQWKKFDTPIVSSDMECSAIFVIATLRGVKAGSILLVNANPESLKDRLRNKKQKVITEANKRESEKNIRRMIKVVLDCVSNMR
jgi:uridine phosphorylase